MDRLHIFGALPLETDHRYSGDLRLASFDRLPRERINHLASVEPSYVG